MPKDSRFKFQITPELRNPCLIATWPGMGFVASKVSSYLLAKLPFTRFGELEGKTFFPPIEVVVENCEITLPPAPKSTFYYHDDKLNDRSVILFTCDAQPEISRGYEFASILIDIAERFKVTRIYTFAAMPSPITHTRKPKVLGAATDKHLLREFEKHNIGALETGRINGLNGLLLGAAAERDMEGICLFGEIPFYAVQFENPLASLRVLETVAMLINADIDYADLIAQSKQEVARIDSFFSFFDLNKISEAPPGQPDIEGDQIIDNVHETHAADKVDELFRQAAQNISKAKELKEELDRQGIYNEYEDRFLDLFRPKKKEVIIRGSLRLTHEE